MCLFIISLSFIISHFLRESYQIRSCDNGFKVIVVVRAVRSILWEVDYALVIVLNVIRPLSIFHHPLSPLEKIYRIIVNRSSSNLTPAGLVNCSSSTILHPPPSCQQVFGVFHPSFLVLVPNFLGLYLASPVLVPYM